MKLLPVVAGIGLALVASSAGAQIRGDIEAYGGVSQRALANPGGGGPLPGPMAGIEGHIALFPLLRLGAYVHGELAPTDDPVATTRMLGAGARAKITSPWPRGSWRVWVALGVGYVTAYSPSYTQNLGGTSFSVDGAGGGFLEIPVSFGVSYRLVKPLIVFAELTTRFGMLFSGSLYDLRAATANDGSGLQQDIGQRGNDVFAAGLALGLGFDL